MRPKECLCLLCTMEGSKLTPSAIQKHPPRREVVPGHHQSATPAQTGAQLHTGTHLQTGTQSGAHPQTGPPLPRRARPYSMVNNLLRPNLPLTSEPLNPDSGPPGSAKQSNAYHPVFTLANSHVTSTGQQYRSPRSRDTSPAIDQRIPTGYAERSRGRSQGPSESGRVPRSRDPSPSVRQHYPTGYATPGSRPASGEGWGNVTPGSRPVSGEEWGNVLQRSIRQGPPRSRDPSPSNKAYSGVVFHPMGNGGLKAAAPTFSHPSTRTYAENTDPSADRSPHQPVNAGSLEGRSRQTERNSTVYSINSPTEQPQSNILYQTSPETPAHTDAASTRLTQEFNHVESADFHPTPSVSSQNGMMTYVSGRPVLQTGSLPRGSRQASHAVHNSVSSSSAPVSPSPGVYYKTVGVRHTPIQKGTERPPSMYPNHSLGSNIAPNSGHLVQHIQAYPAQSNPPSMKPGHPQPSMRPLLPPPRPRAPVDRSKISLTQHALNPSTDILQFPVPASSRSQMAAVVPTAMSSERRDCVAGLGNQSSLILSSSLPNRGNSGVNVRGSADGEELDVSMASYEFSPITKVPGLPNFGFFKPDKIQVLPSREVKSSGESNGDSKLPIQQVTCTIATSLASSKSQDTMPKTKPSQAASPGTDVMRPPAQADQPHQPSSDNCPESEQAASDKHQTGSTDMGISRNYSSTVPLPQATAQVRTVDMSRSSSSGSVTVPSAKVFLMDKYFEEMARTWNKTDQMQGTPPEDVDVMRRQLRAMNNEMVLIDQSIHHGQGHIKNTNETQNQVNTAHQQDQTDQKGVIGDETDEVKVNNESSFIIPPSSAPLPSGTYENGCMFQKSGVVAGTTDIRNSYSASNLSMYAQLEDLTHLPGPVTEDSLLKALQARFYTGQYYSHIGPVLLALNPHTCIPSPRALSEEKHPCPTLRRMVYEVTRHQLEDNQSQVFILDGISGSGKTHTAMLLLRQLFDVAGGGAETDTFKHLRATFTVLRTLGSAATLANAESSRMGYFMENHITDGAIYRTKIHCYFMDQNRIIHPPAGEKNYHVFYQLLAGLPPEDKAKYQLIGYSPVNLRYLNCGDWFQDEAQDRTRFHAWKTSLSVLGIPFADIMRLMAAILLLGNIEFVEGPGLELEVQGNEEIKSVAALLGVPAVALYRGLTTQTQRARGQTFKALADPITANRTRHALSQALYTRTVSAIVKRANSCKRPNSNSTVSSDSNDSGNHDVTMPNGMSDGGHPKGSHKPPAMLHSPQISGQSGGGSYFIGILDMFGFEDAQTNQLEQISLNLCAETLQHFYNTHIFISAQQACADEGIQPDMDVNYFNNAPIIELISSQRTGLLSLLDAECSLQNGSVECYVQRARLQHTKNKNFFEPASHDVREFGISHFAGKVLYDASNFLVANRDQLSDDIISIFSKHCCSFGFITHLFNSELKVIQDQGDGAKGTAFRVSPPASADITAPEIPTTVAWDFQARLDNLLQILVHSRPHFIRCIKSNSEAHRELFEREMVKSQLRSMQILETTYLMAAGFPHRLRYPHFNQRYRLLVNSRAVNMSIHGKHFEESRLILDHFSRLMDERQEPSSSTLWALGKKHVFLSEKARQNLEMFRDQKQCEAATAIQSSWRRRICVKKWPLLKRQLQMRQRQRDTTPVKQKERVRRNSMIDHTDFKKGDQSLLQHTLNIYGLDMDLPPPLPASRSYTVQGNIKFGYPQMRVMKQNYADKSSGELLKKGQEVKVIRSSQKRGYLVVEGLDSDIHVPFKITEIKTTPLTRRNSTSHLPGIDV